MFEWKQVKVTSPTRAAVLRMMQARNDARDVSAVIEEALQDWLLKAACADPPAAREAARGYQWKSLFLPSGTCVRFQYRRRTYYAEVRGDRLFYDGRTFSPRQLLLHVTGTVRNAWRELWLREPHDARWHLADTRRHLLRRTPRDTRSSPPDAQTGPMNEADVQARASGELANAELAGSPGSAARPPIWTRLTPLSALARLAAKAAHAWRRWRQGAATGDAVTAGAVTPCAVTPGAVTADAVTPGAVTEGAVTAGAVTAGVVTAGAVTERAVTEDAVNAGTDTGVTTAAGSSLDPTEPAAIAEVSLRRWLQGGRAAVRRALLRRDDIVRADQPDLTCMQGGAGRFRAGRIGPRDRRHCGDLNKLLHARRPGPAPGA